MKISQAEYLSAHKCAIGEKSELRPAVVEHLDRYAFPLIQEDDPAISKMPRSNAQIHRNLASFEEQKEVETPPPPASAFTSNLGQLEGVRAEHPHANEDEKLPELSSSAPTQGFLGNEAGLKLRTGDSLRTIDPAPKRVSEMNLNLDIGEMWDIHSERLTKSLRSEEKPAGSLRSPKRQLQRLNSFGKVVGSQLARMSPKKPSERSKSFSSKFRSPCPVDEARVEQTAAALKSQSDPNVSVPRRQSSNGPGSPSLSAYRRLFSQGENAESSRCTWEQVDIGHEGARAPRRRKSMMPMPVSNSQKSRMTPLEKKLGYGGMAPMIGNAIAGSFYRKTRSKSFTNRREKGFMGYSQSRSTTFMKEFEMDPSRPLQRSSSSRSSRSSFSGSLRSKSLVLRKKSSSTPSEPVPPPESVEDRRSDFERKALEYIFNYKSENLRNDRESYLAYRAKLNRTSSFRNEREQRSTRYNHMRSHSFTNGLPEIHEDEMPVPHPNKDNTTNDNIKRRTQRNPVAA